MEIQCHNDLRGWVWNENPQTLWKSVLALQWELAPVSGCFCSHTWLIPHWTSSWCTYVDTRLAHLLGFEGCTPKAQIVCEMMAQGKRAKKTLEINLGPFEQGLLVSLVLGVRFRTRRYVQVWGWCYCTALWFNSAPCPVIQPSSSHRGWSEGTPYHTDFEELTANCGGFHLKKSLQV